MKLVYYQDTRKNFGDDLNEWLWDEILPGWRDWDNSASLVGVGTILNANFLPSGKKIILGSGLGYGEQPDISDASIWDIRSVRGPKTAKALGLDAGLSICDPAMVIPLIPRFKRIDRGGDIVFVPHISTDSMYDWERICRNVGVKYQSPCDDSEIVIRRLATANKVIAESMHAAIISDAFSTPWTAVSINRGFNEFKWNDWAASLGIENLNIYNFFPLLKRLQNGLKQSDHRAVSSKRKPANRQVPPRKGKILAALASYHLNKVSKGPFGLSDRANLRSCQDRFGAVLDDVRRRYG